MIADPKKNQQDLSRASIAGVSILPSIQHLMSGRDAHITKFRPFKPFIGNLEFTPQSRSADMLLLVLQVFVICNNTEEQYQGARLTPRSFEVRAHNKLAPDE